MHLFQSDRFMLLMHSQIGHKLVTFSTRNIGGGPEITIVFWNVQYMETMMAYHGFCISEVKAGAELDALKLKLAPTAKSRREQRLFRGADLSPHPLSPLEITDDYLDRNQLRFYRLESPRYTGFLCATGFAVSSDGDTVFDTRNPTGMRAEPPVNDPHGQEPAAMDGPDVVSSPERPAPIRGCHHCRVCGLWHDLPPWGDDDRTPSFAHCACCGREAGYQDVLPVGARRFRERWLAGGAQWLLPGATPDEWDREEQMRNIPEPYR